MNGLCQRSLIVVALLLSATAYSAEECYSQDVSSQAEAAGWNIPVASCPSATSPTPLPAPRPILITPERMLVSGNAPLKSPSHRHPAGGDPVLGDGEFFEQRTDAALGGEGVAFEFKRTYRSRISFKGPLGYSWDHNYDQRILQPSLRPVQPACDNTLDFQDGELNVIHFVPDIVATTNAGHTVWRADGTGLTLQQVAGNWQMLAADGSSRWFDSQGYLSRLVDVVGNQLTFTWELAAGDAVRRLSTVSDGVHVVHYIYRSSDSILQCISLGTDCGDETRRSPDVLAYFTYTVANELKSALHGEDVVGETIAYVAVGPNIDSWPRDCLPNATVSQMCSQLCNAVDPANPLATCHNVNIAPRLGNICAGYYGCDWKDPNGPHVPENLIGCTVGNPASADDKCMQAYGVGRDANHDCLTGCGWENQCVLTTGKQAYYSYGIVDDLVHNISDIYDEHGVLEVHNDYGQSPWDVSYDRVVKQTIGSDGKNVVTFAYHDLVVESGIAPVYLAPGVTRYPGAPSTPDPANVIPQAQFYENVVCPPTTDCTHAPDGSCLTTYSAPASGTDFEFVPTNAVLITDEHGARRTQYFDSDYNLIREVNVSLNESRDFNYAHGYLVGVQEPSGVRECYERDANGRTTQSTTLPASGHAGTQTPMATAYRYDSAGQVTDEWRDAFGTLSKTHYTRDSFERVIAKDQDVTVGQPPLHTTYGYDADHVPVGIRETPSNETLPDGTLNDNFRTYDAAGHLARVDFTIDAGSTIPEHRYALYDDRGRITENGEVDRYAVHYQYDTGNRLALVGHRDSKAASWFDTSYSWYDEFGTMPSVVGEPTRTTTIDYLDNQPKTITIDGIPTCEHYDPDGRLEAEILPAGNMLEYGYDDAGRLTTVAKGYESNPPTDAWAQACVPKTPPANDPGVVALTQRWYESGGFLSWFRENGVVRTVVNDGFGHVIQVNDANAASHETGYDSRGRVIWSADVAAGTAYGKPTMTQSGLLTMTEYDYDFLDRIVAERYWHIETGDVLTVTYTYDDVNRIVTRTDRGVTTTMTSDGRGRVVTMTAADGSVTTIDHELDYDLVTQQTGQPQALVRRLQHDTRGRVTAILDENKTVLSSVQYDDHDNHLVETSIGAASVIRTFDDFDRLFTEHKDLGNGSSIDAKYERDANGRVWRYTDSAGKPWLFTYTGLDSPLTTTDPVGRVDSYSYMPGWAPPSGRIDPAGRHRCFRYDNELRFAYVYDVDCPGGSDIRGAVAPLMDRRSYEYSPLGQLAKVTVDMKDDAHSGNDYVSDTYDSLGRVVDEQVSSTTSPLAGYVVHHDYPGDGRTTVTQLTGYPTIPPPPPGFQYCDPPPPHGGQGQPMVGKRCIPTPDQPPPFFATFRHSYDYVGHLQEVDLNGNRLAWWTWPSGATGPQTMYYADQTRTDYDYDSRLRMTKMTVSQILPGTGDGSPPPPCPPGEYCPPPTHNVAIATLQDAYGADSVVRMRQRTFGAAAAMTDVYQVDGDARVTAEALAVPNVTMPTGEVDETTVSKYMGAGAWRYFSVDGNGNWLSTATAGAGAVTQQNDATGLLQSIGANAMTVDVRGNLQQLTGDALAFKYDDYSGLLEAASNGTSAETYQYDALDRRSVEQQGRTTNVIVWDGQSIIAHGGAMAIIVDVPGEDIDEHVASVDSSGVARFYHQASDESVFAITDATGLIEAYSYSSFGDTTVRSSSGTAITGSLVGNRYGFQGQWWNPTTNTYAMRARQYVPKWGRFSSADPLSIDAAPSLFSFTGSRPLTYRDPLGLSFDPSNCNDGSCTPGSGGGGISSVPRPPSDGAPSPGVPPAGGAPPAAGGPPSAAGGPSNGGSGGDGPTPPADRPFPDTFGLGVFTGGGDGDAGGGYPGGLGGGSKRQRPNVLKLPPNRVLAMNLPPDPTQLPPDWTLDPTHLDPNGKRYVHPSGDRLDFHKGRPGRGGWKGKDHWHYNGSDKHYRPGDYIPDPVPVCSNKRSCDANDRTVEDVSDDLGVQHGDPVAPFWMMPWLSPGVIDFSPQPTGVRPVFEPFPEPLPAGLSPAGL